MVVSFYHQAKLLQLNIQGMNMALNLFQKQ
jgi:hypothetical protein